MKRKKLNTPSSVSYRLDECIEFNINSIISKSGVTKTQVIRSLFNLGLDTFFSGCDVVFIDDESLSILMDEAQLNKAKHKLSDPQNCTLTIKQVEDLEKIGIINHIGKGQAIRLIFHIGVSEFYIKYKKRIEPYEQYAIKNNEEVSKIQELDVHRDIIHYNCFDKA